MIHEIIQFAADASPTSGSDDSFKVQIVVGVVTIVVALLGKVGKDSLEKKRKNGDAPLPLSREDRRMENDLMKQRTALEREKQNLRGEIMAKDVIIGQREADIVRLRDLCWLNNINPNNGQKVV